MGLDTIMKAMKSNFTDDKKLFQGGEKGRLFGRLRDKLEGNSTSYDPGMEADNELAVHARAFAKNLDVGNKDDVLEMQGMLNQLGIGDFEGQQLKADGMIGDRTTSAIRALQGKAYEGGETAEDVGFPWYGGDKPDGNSARSWVQELFGGASRDTRQARNSLFERQIPSKNPRRGFGGDDSGYGWDVWGRKGENMPEDDDMSQPGPWSDGSSY